jgi:hypothetical protein
VKRSIVCSVPETAKDFDGLMKVEEFADVNPLQLAP